MQSRLPPPARLQELLRACLSHNPMERPSAQGFLERVRSCSQLGCAICAQAPVGSAAASTGRYPCHHDVHELPGVPPALPGMQVQALLEEEGGAELAAVGEDGSVNGSS